MATWPLTLSPYDHMGFELLAALFASASQNAMLVRLWQLAQPAMKTNFAGSWFVLIYGHMAFVLFAESA